MTVIACIVEGYGEVAALPVLLHRLATARNVHDLRVPPPIRVHRDQFLRKNEEFRRKLLLAGAKAGDDGTVLVMLDGDDECPLTLAEDIRARATPLLSGTRLSVVIPHREYEAWFLAGAASLAGLRGLAPELTPPSDAEAIRNTKGWLSERIQTGRYHEVSDQPALTAKLDLTSAAKGSRSLRKLIKELDAALGIASR